MLARLLAVATCLSVCLSVCVSVCLSQVGVLTKRMNESSWFWEGNFLPPILHCVLRKFGYLQNKDTSPTGTLSQTPDLEISPLHTDRRNVLSTKLDKDGRRSAKLIIHPSSDCRPLVYHTNHQALYTARFRRAGLLATTDTC